METKKFCLTERQMPTQWYNIVADMPNKPLPPLHPATKQPVTKEQMSAIFAEELIDQEMSAERFIDIPEEVQEIYKIWRPTPLVRATGLEKALGTPAKIYFKNESVSPAGSHKPNTAVPQAYYNYKQGIRRLTTETGAGQWGAAIAFAAKHFGIDLQVYMVKVSYDQKPYRRLMMNTWGAECIASPSTLTASGRAALERDPNCSGSLGLAISEAIEVALQHPEDTRYCLGSVLNHVILHQTVIGQEAVAQMEMADAEPDVVIGCFGGGSNFAGRSSASCSKTDSSKRSRCRRPRPSPQAFSSPRPRASSRRRNRRTPSPRPSAKPCRPKRRGRPRRFCSTSQATA